MKIFRFLATFPHFFYLKTSRFLGAFPTGLRSRSRKKSEVFGWSRIPNNSGSRIFRPTPDVELDHFLHHILKLQIPVEMVQFHLKLLLRRDFLLCNTISIDFNIQVSFHLC